MPKPIPFQYTRGRLQLFLCFLAIALLSSPALAQTTAFRYQGRLSDGNAPANGNYDMQFALYDAISGGNQAGATITNASVSVTNGIFSVPLDFGSGSFPGADRFLAISVRPSGSANAYAVLSPRQPITPTPYSIHALNAANADALSSACIGCVQDAQINAVAGSKVSGTIQLEAMPPGSTSYIQNSTSPQPASAFNISGNGTAGGALSADVVNATTQYNLKGNRLLTMTGGSINPYQNSNTIAGFGAGASTAPAASSAFGNLNSFFGISAGHTNTTGAENAFFGANAGYWNLTGIGNSFFGDFAGNANSTSSNNSFFGSGAGYSSTGYGNSFFGQQSGNSNSTGVTNSFFGIQAGVASTQGSNNTFLGALAGFTNTTGGNNTLIGSVADVGNSNLTNATAIGANAYVSQSNSLVLGSISGVNSAAGDTKVGIGTTSPASPLTVVSGSAGLTVSITNSTSSGNGLSATSQGGAGVIGSSVSGSGVSGSSTSGNGVSGSSVTGYAGSFTGNVKATGTLDAGSNVTLGSAASNNVALTIRGPNSPADPNSAQDIRFSFASAGSSAVRAYRGSAWDTYLSFLTNNISAGSDTPQVRMTINDSGNVGIGTTTPADKLHVIGEVRVNACVRNFSGTGIAGSCPSDARFKKNITPFVDVLSKLVQLRPVHFDWRADEFPSRHFGNDRSFGLIAQEAEKILPELVTEDEEGYRAVQYSELPLLTIQALIELNEQKNVLEDMVTKQRTQMLEQREEIRDLKSELAEIAAQLKAVLRDSK